MIQFLRDLALLPTIWRRAVKDERSRRYRASPEGRRAYEDARIAEMAGRPEIQARLLMSLPSRSNRQIVQSQGAGQGGHR